MSFKASLLAKYWIKAESIGHFILPSKMLKNIKSIDNFSNTSAWKVRSLLRAPVDGKLGDYDSVDKVGFEPSLKLLVPLGYADCQHKSGVDALAKLMKTNIIPKGKYYTIRVAGDGINYIFSKDTVKEIIQVYKRWLELGGPDLTVKVDNSTKSFSDFIKGRGGIHQKAGKLTSDAKELISLLEKIAILYKKTITEQPTPRNLKSLSNYIFLLDAFVTKHNNVLSFPKKLDIERVATDIFDGKDIDKNMQVIFGFDGLKNLIHNELRKVEVNTKIKTLFGDPKFALEEFNRLSSI